MTISRLLLLPILLTGCNIGKPYCPPMLEVPNQWKGPTSETTQTKTVCHWWEMFDDPVLNGLEEQAVVNNQSIHVAFERMCEAKALARVLNANLYPGLMFDPSFSDEMFLIKGEHHNFRYHEMDNTLPLNLCYEIDLWGKLHNEYYAGIAYAEAAYETLCTVLLAITGDVAQSYFRLRSLDAEQEILQQGIAVRQYAVEINQSLYNSGMILYADVSRAQVELFRTRAESTNVTRQRDILENVLAVLCGAAAPEFCVEVSPLSGSLPEIPTGIPSDILCQRPDIAEAEHKMAALHAEIRVTYALQFPSLTLTGSLGMESPDLVSLLSWKARLWAMAANITQSVFDAGRNSAKLDAAKARFQEGIYLYQQQVLVAFQEVEDSLANIHKRTAQAIELEQAAQAAQETTNLSQERYNKGLVGYLDVVDAERSYLETSRHAAVVNGERYIATVQLIKALGGTWQQ